MSDEPGSASMGLFEATFHSAPASMAILDTRGRIIAVNRRWARSAVERGGRADAYLGDNYLDAVPAGLDPVSDRLRQQVEALLDGSATSMHLEYPCHEPGRQRWFMMRGIRFEYEGGDAVMVVHTDITDRYLAEQAAREAASRDPLTGLLNRRSLKLRAEQLLASARRNSEMAGVIFIDLDDFKAVNDGLGHAAGDELLKAVAEGLEHTLRESDVCARVGGDEFVAVCPATSRDEIAAVVDRLAAELGQVTTTDLVAGDIGMSIGVSLFPDDADHLRDLIELADRAMYHAKQHPDRSVVWASDIVITRADEPG